MNTHEQYVTLTTAKLLKQAGFDWATMNTYWANSYSKEYLLDNEMVRMNWNDENVLAALKHQAYTDIISAPTQAVAMRWLREVKEWYVTIIPQKRWQDWVIIYESAISKNKGVIKADFSLSTYEQAAEIGIQGCLKAILKEQEQ